MTLTVTLSMVVTGDHMGTNSKQTQNHRYGDNRKMAAGFAYRI